jgi:hypothetical protein
MDKITIRTDLLESLNKGIAGREEAFTNVNKANTEDNRANVKPQDLIGDTFLAKDSCGEIGSEGDSTIAGCVNTIASEMAAFIEGVIGVDEADVSSLTGEEATEEEDTGGGTTGGGWYGGGTTPVTTDTTTTDPTEGGDEDTEDEDEDSEEEEGEEVTVTPIVVEGADLVGEFATGGTDGDDSTTGTSEGIGTVSITESDVQITDGQGNVVGTVSDGQYTVYEQTTDEQGNVIAVRISKDGEDEQWIVMNQNGKQVGTFYETNQVGSFSCTSDGIVITDANGNPIGTLTQGNHKVYAINVDENTGVVTAIRISKDGEPEQWIQIYKDGKYIDGGVFEQYGQAYTNPQTYDNGQGTTATVYGKRNKILGGVLGVLVVGLGATIYVKKKKEKEDGSYEEEEEELSSGDYDIYDYNTDDDGNITEARISDDDAAEEQWVEF